MRKKFRVKRESDFQKVFHHGKSFANRQLVIYVFPKTNQEHFRVGFSVGKKIGNAVTRNQIKRYLRQGILELEEYIEMDVDFILIARQDILTKSFQEIKQSLIHVMSLAGVLDKSKL